MTIRMTRLMMFGLICLAAGSMACSPLAQAGPFSRNNSAQAAEHGSQGTGEGRFGGRLRQNRQQSGTAGRQGFGNRGQDNGQDAQDNAQSGDKRSAIQDELKNLPPDQRRAKIQEVLKQKQQQFQNRWDQATPEERAKFCSSVQQKCTGGNSGGEQFACQSAKAKCAGQ